MDAETRAAWERQKAVEATRRAWEWRIFYSEAGESFLVSRDVRGVEVFARDMRLADAVAVREVADGVRPMRCEFPTCGRVATRFEHGGFYCGDCAVGGA